MHQESSKRALEDFKFLIFATSARVQEFFNQFGGGAGTSAMQQPPK